jgi:hypothetical protein
MNNQILNLHHSLVHHPMYNQIRDLASLRTFMSYHVLAVWDFMSLLKSLQRHITCVELPWFDSKYNPEMVRLINQIVVGEESDVDQSGRAASHFSLYLRAMDEVGADKSLINKLLATRDISILPQEIKEIVHFHLNVAMNAPVHEVAACFFYGREKLIPEMFTSIVEILKNAGLNCPTLIYYLEHHIELDGEDHGPKAMTLMTELADCPTKIKEVEAMAIKSLQKRSQLWNYIQNQIKVYE